MKNILHLISSPHGSESVSIKLGNAIVAQLKAAYPGAVVKENNLAQNPYPHLNQAQVKALRSPRETLTTDELALLQRPDAAVQELFDADIIIISLPLFNFGIPSSLKTWLDNIARGGITFSYGENGPVGLVTGKKACIAMASGGVYSQGPMQEYDHAIPHLTRVLNFIGITDISVIRAEGLGIPGLKETALEKAIDSITVS